MIRFGIHCFDSVEFFILWEVFNYTGDWSLIDWANWIRLGFCLDIGLAIHWRVCILDWIELIFLKKSWDFVDSWLDGWKQFKGG